MMIVAIDPGPEQSTWVTYDPSRARPVLKIGRDWDNQVVLELLYDLREGQIPVCEGLECFGMAVGRETFDTVRWTGRFQEACLRTDHPFHLLPRSRVKSHLCHAANANDAEIRMALLDRFGPGRAKAIGLKKSPGPLYGIAEHAWSALALAVTWCNLHPHGDDHGSHEPREPEHRCAQTPGRH